MPKLSSIFAKIKIAAALGKVVLTGKNSKILDKIEQGTEIAEAVKELLKKEKAKT